MRICTTKSWGAVSIAVLSMLVNTRVLAEPLVVANTVVFDGGPNGGAGLGDYIFRVIQEPPPNGDVSKADHTSMWLDASFDRSTSTWEIAVAAINLDEGSDWFLVREGEVFSSNGVDSSDYPFLTDVDRDVVETLQVTPDYWSNWVSDTVPPPSEPWPLVDHPVEFFLGYRTGVGLGFGENNRDVYGWVQLRTRIPSGLSLIPAELELVSSGTAFSSDGIVVGALISVPEPTSVALFACCLAWRSRRYRE